MTNAETAQSETLVRRSHDIAVDKPNGACPLTCCMAGGRKAGCTPDRQAAEVVCGQGGT